MSERGSTVPPAIDGLDPVEILGSGGHANVYLYRQRVPLREVAVKILTSEAVAPDAFTSEANLMARVSAHPYIVTIFEARVSDDGRPYLIMEYYSGPNLLHRIRDERITVADALRIGIQIGGALETAHRAGVLHRDVKPANILTSQFGRPGLSDFGIASADGVDSVDGVSIPWAPPEAFASGPLTPAADIYSLGATIYHLLAGRTPFAANGDGDDSTTMVARIAVAPVPPTGRSDVPASLERLLANTMAKHPAHRPASVADFARSLQSIEIEMRLSVTHLDVPQTRNIIPRADGHDEYSTEVREAYMTTDPSSPVESVETAPVHRGRGRRRALMFAALAGILLAGVSAIWVLGRDSDSSATRFVEAEEITLPVQEPSPGVVVQSSWMVTETGVPSGTTRIVNETGDVVQITHDEVVPKELVGTADELDALPEFDSVVDADPVVRYCITLEPGETFGLRWTGPRLAEPIDADALVRFAVDWERRSGQQSNSTNATPCEFDAEPAAASTTSVVPSSTSRPPTSTTTAPPTSTTIPISSTTAPVAAFPSGGSTGGSTSGTGGSTSSSGGGTTSGGSGGSTTGSTSGGSTGGTATTAATTTPTTTTTTSQPPPPPPAPPPPTDPPPPSSAQVPNVVGSDYSAGAGRIQAAGFTPSKNPVPCSGQPSSQIVSQSPGGGSSATPGSTVRLDTCI